MKRERVVQLAVLVAILIAGVRHSSENERLAVSRLGLPSRVAGPGLTWQLPMVEKSIKVSLEAAVPGWRDIDAAEVDRLVLEYAIQNDLFPQ